MKNDFEFKLWPISIAGRGTTAWAAALIALVLIVGIVAGWFF